MLVIVKGQEQTSPSFVQVKYTLPYKMFLLLQFPHKLSIYIHGHNFTVLQTFSVRQALAASKVHCGRVTKTFLHALFYFSFKS